MKLTIIIHEKRRITLKRNWKETVCFSETSVSTYESTRRHDLEGQRQLMKSSLVDIQLDTGRRDFHEIWYGRRIIGGYSKLVRINFLQLVGLTPASRIRKLRRQGDDAITRAAVC
jgi:hypothetical protein